MPVPTARLPARHGLAALLDWAADHLDADLSVDALAAAGRDVHRVPSSAISPRPPARPRPPGCATSASAAPSSCWNATDATVAAVARRCGFGSPDTLRRHFRRARGVTPEAYRAAFRQSS